MTEAVFQEHLREVLSRNHVTGFAARQFCQDLEISACAPSENCPVVNRDFRIHLLTEVGKSDEVKIENSGDIQLLVDLILNLEANMQSPIMLTELYFNQTCTKCARRFASGESFKRHVLDLLDATVLTCIEPGVTAKASKSPKHEDYRLQVVQFKRTQPEDVVAGPLEFSARQVCHILGLADALLLLGGDIIKSKHGGIIGQILSHPDGRLNGQRLDKACDRITSLKTLGAKKDLSQWVAWQNVLHQVHCYLTAQRFRLSGFSQPEA